jgi:hypothetical protein
MTFISIQVTKDSHRITSKIEFGFFRRTSRISSVSNGEAPQPMSKDLAKGDAFRLASVESSG